MEHGTRARYRAGCTCLPCRAANAAYHRAYYQGVSPQFVDAGAARSHIAKLRGLGMGVPRIATLSGLSRRHLWRIVAGTVTTIRQPHEAAILAVSYQPAPGALVKFHKAWRHLGILQREGFTLEDVRRAIGQRAKIVQEKTARVRTVLAIRRFYHRHCVIDGEDPNGEEE